MSDLASELEADLEATLHPEGSTEALQRVVAVLIIAVTLLGAVFAYLQTQASDRESTAQQMAKAQSLATMSALVEQNRQYSLQASSYDLSNDEAWFRHEYALQEDTTPAGRYATALSAVHGTVADDLGRYRGHIFPASLRAKDGTLDYVSFVESEQRPLYRSGELAKAYSVQRDGWSGKGSRFVTVITVLAVALFLLGLTLTVPGRARRPFLWMGSAVALAAAIWGTVIWSEDVPSPNPRAIEAYVRGQASLDVAELPPDPKDQRAHYDAALRDLTSALTQRHDYAQAYLARAEVEFLLDFLNPKGPQGSRAARDDWTRGTELDPSNFVGWGDLGAAQFWLGEYEGALDSNERALALRPTNDVFTMNKAIYFSVLRRDREYAAQLPRVRAVLAGEPTWLRRDTVDRFERLVFDIGAAYRPAIKPQIDRFRDDVHVIDHEITASLRTLGRTTPAPTKARLGPLRFELAHDRKAVRVRFAYQGVDRRARWLYDTTVGTVRSDPLSYGPKPWSFQVPDGGIVLTFPGNPVWRAGAEIHVEVFVDGNLLTQGSYTVP